MMDEAEMKATVQRAREALADQQHEIWSSWMRWMFTVGTFNEDGAWTMPVGLVMRWKRQMDTPYAQLSEDEKDSDRREADKSINALSVLLAALDQRELAEAREALETVQEAATRNDDLDGVIIANAVFGKGFVPPTDPLPVNADHYRLELHDAVQEALGWLTPAEIETAVDFAIQENLE